MAQNDGPLPEEPARDWSRILLWLGLGAAFLAAVVMTVTMAWPEPPAPPPPCYYDVTSLEPYPYQPPDGGVPLNPMGLEATATAHAEAYPGVSAYAGLDDLRANATAWAAYAPTASAYATRCAGLDVEQRAAEATVQADAGMTRVAAQAVGATATPTFTPTATRTATRPPTATAAAPAPDLVRGHPASAGLRFSAIGALWQLDQAGEPRRVVDLPQFVSDVQPDGRYAAGVEGGDLYVYDLATGSQTNLTQGLGTQEESARFWPARPDTLVHVFYGPVDGRSGVHLQLGTLNLDGTDGRAIGVLGDLGRTSFALGDDGDTIAFVQGLDIVMVRMSDGARRVLAPGSLGLSPACDLLQGPGMSPDLGALATRCFFRNEVGNGDEAVLIVDRGTGLGRILDRHVDGDFGREWAGWPVLWSPDGRYVIVVEELEVGQIDRVVRVADGALVARLPGRVHVFSPDGQWAVVQALTADAPAPWFLVDTATWSVAVPIAIPQWADHVVWPE